MQEFYCWLRKLANFFSFQNNFRLCFLFSEKIEDGKIFSDWSLVCAQSFAGQCYFHHLCISPPFQKYSFTLSLTTQPAKTVTLCTTINPRGRKSFAPKLNFICNLNRLTFNYSPFKCKIAKKINLKWSAYTNSLSTMPSPFEERLIKKFLRELI